MTPSSDPVFMSEFYSYYQPKPISATDDMYADLVRGIAKDSDEELYPEGDGIWQDDGARIHRCPQALQAVFDSFNDRIDHEAQAPKMADI